MNAECPPGTVFLYPCAGHDIAQPIEAFGSRFETFVFVDIRYRFDRFDMPAPTGWGEVAGSVATEGQLHDEMLTVTTQRHRYRDITPAWRRSRYRHAASGREIAVVFRRGFGQYALHELPDAALGMFLHRGDSSGEGGSGVVYLGNRRMDHPPLSMLMDVVKRKLAVPALVGSDGSNTSIEPLRRAAEGDDSVPAFVSHGLRWERMEALPSKARLRTVVWQVAPLPG